MLGFLCILLGVILVITYFLSNYDAISPSCLFCVGFLFCALVAWLASPMWNYDMSLGAFYVILIGVLLFCLCATMIHLICFRKDISAYPNAILPGKM